ncbi:T9SS type A sorting domain-containing protein, partial [bacterium]|nr:T9SS type A sorting domain-containing protein [bacterium]
LRGGVNNPQPFPDYPTYADTSFEGIANDRLTGDFIDDPFRIHPSLLFPDERVNWTDDLSQAPGTRVIFTGVDSAKIVGVRKGTDPVAGRITAYISFPMQYAVEYDRGELVANRHLETFMENLGDWFNPFLTVPEENSSTVARTPVLSQNFPNPFNPETTISFSIPITDRATLKVFDLQGREVALLFDGMLTGGVGESRLFDGAKMASGIYYYTLSTSSGIDLTRKMMLIK